MTALAGLLTGAFAAADGSGLDLQLSGAAPLVAAPGTLRTQRLGAGEMQSSTGALWTASVETASDQASLIVPFDGIRN